MQSSVSPAKQEEGCTLLLTSKERHVAIAPIAKFCVAVAETVRSVVRKRVSDQRMHGGHISVALATVSMAAGCASGREGGVGRGKYESQSGTHLLCGTMAPWTEATRAAKPRRNDAARMVVAGRRTRADAKEGAGVAKKGTAFKDGWSGSWGRQGTF